jgi:effector-binding domain-containing protein
LNRILALKDLGLSLDQIMKMLQAEVSDDEIQGMLMLKKAEVEQALLDDLQRLRRIESRLQQNQMANSTPDVVIKSIPAQLFFSVRTQSSTEADILHLVDQILRVIPAEVGSNVLGSPAGIFYGDDFSSSDNVIELGYLLKKAIEKPFTLSKDHVLQMRELPPVQTMASSIQAEGIDPVLVGFGKIAQWIEDNGYQMVGPYREIMFDVASINDLEHATIEIQVPVERINPSQHLQLNLPA